MDSVEDPDSRNPVGHTGSPDIMNDPAYTTNYGTKGKHGEEADTCRICRAEGSEDEPLFYPCKCSGSIKFVHQPCLMEWLSHSQKKYCELCKTPFRFTKLYDPNMPQELPAPVFAKELFFHASRTVLTWLRFLLVAFVWLGWLPWSMRAIWRGLFWLADGRWPNSESHQSRLAALAEDRLAQLAANGTTPVQHTLASNSPITSTAAQSVASAIPQILSPVSSMLNFSDGEPMIFSVAKKIFQIAFVSSSAAGLSYPNSTNTTSVATRQRQPSWLSDVSLLNNLTPSPTFNNVIIDTLEGQLITLLVVISFILIFLIREWVVQQQPGLNAENEGAAAAQLLAGDNADHAAEPVPEEAGAVQPDDDDDGEVEPTLEFENEALRPYENREPGRPPAESPPAAPSIGTEVDPIDPARPTTSRSTSRPALQSRNALDDASNIRRTIEEAGAAPGILQRPEIDTFRDLWDRASGDPTEILRIIEVEGRQDELDWIVSLMNNLQRIKRGPNPSPDVPPEASASSASGPSGNTDGASSTPMTFSGLPTPQTSHPTKHAEDIPIMPSPSVPRHAPSFGNISEPFTFTHGSPPAGMWETGESSHAPNVSQNYATPGGGNDNVGMVDIPRAEAHNDFAQTASPDNTVDEPTIVDGPPIILGGQDPEPAAIETPREAAPVEPVESDAPPQTLIERVTDWFWGDVPAVNRPQDAPENNDNEDEQLDQEPPQPAQNRPVPVEDFLEDNNIAVDGAAAGAGERVDPNDIEAVDDADDLEGVMELIGMQGPIFGLLQNGVFSALLVSFTVAVGIWLPYLWGKIALVFLTNPVRLFVGAPLAILSLVVDVVLDSLIGCFGYVVYGVNMVLKAALGPMAGGMPWLNKILGNTSITTTSLSLISGSGQRLKRVADAFFSFRESDLPMFSVISHQALHIHQARITKLFQVSYQIGKFVVYDLPLVCVSYVRQQTTGATTVSSATDISKMWNTSTETIMSVAKSPLALLPGSPGSKSGGDAETTTSFDYDLAHWDTKDRIIAIIVGYVFAFLAGLLYLRVVRFMSQMNRGQRFEGVIAEVLQQAGGVMKVILIIGIEMIVFPLYCGLLLDFALMPLFENATLMSRVAFTFGSPLTSLFVHWFVGTCYMFHFALFVSMCRKVMRRGVLYFIRDPDDPTFHPVRDVLERNITTQLRKIAFSALVYGALVIFCLGGVVWGLAFAFKGVLPIHWSSNEPVLEFPVDLLFYNFVMPLAIRWIRPSDGLQEMYDWWFHKCARFLRLTNFLFGDRRVDEEGRHIRTTWRALLSGLKGDTENPVLPDGEKEEQKPAYFLRDGRFVRSPASDQVRIPKGGQVFVEVNENNERIDGAPDKEDGLHGKSNEMFAKVYIPPHFRLRICTFIFLIWVFAATTGVGTTIVPLVIGRRMISSLFPSHLRVNDIYAFSAGIYIFGGICYAIFHFRRGLEVAKLRLRPYLDEPRRAIPEAYSMAMHFLRLVYISATFSLLLPSLFALVMELYVLVPLHTYLDGDQEHIIYIVQDWTLGVLYVRMAIKFILWYTNSRPARALNAIMRNGWFNPDVKLATRAFIVPAVSLALFAILSPLPLGFLANATIFRGATAAMQSNIYRYSYPGAFVISVALWTFYLLRRQMGIWRVSIRDDVYLVGERLHNLGEKRARDVGAARRMITS
ncbi:hypothetical protein FQN54_000772 [Arachnomyces sp. PD_36]|nr:hypothetical protein FQN54_000772 [Arachnomyces sp. PD_36]